MRETDDSVYYSEIVEYLRHQSESNGESRLEAWAVSKSRDPVKWLRTMERRAQGYFLAGDQLCRGNRSRHRAVVVTVKERHGILKSAHVQQRSGVHVGVSKMYACISGSYFWQGLYRDVRDFVSKCGRCVEGAPRSRAVGTKAFGTSGGASRGCWGGQVWTEVEVHVLPAPLRKQSSPKLIVLADPVSHWISAQAVNVHSLPNNVSEAAADFVFSTFCTLGFPSTCTVISESGIKTDALWEKMRSLMEPLKLDCRGEEVAASVKAGCDRGDPRTEVLPSLVHGPSSNVEGEGWPSLPVVRLQSSPCARSSCQWAWDSARGYMSKESWPVGLDAFLFEERAQRGARPSAFSLMFGRPPVCRVEVSKRRKFSLPKRPQQEVRGQQRGGVDSRDGSPHAVQPPSPVPTPPLALREGPREVRDLESASEGGVPTKPGKKTRRGKSTLGNWRTTCGGVKKQRQRGMGLCFDVREAGLSSKAAGEQLPRDSQRAMFMAQAVASVKALLTAERKKHPCRGNYQRYSPELREEIAKYALCHGISHTLEHFTEIFGGKPISQSTIRNFVRLYGRKPARGHPPSCLRNKVLSEEEVGRFSACSGTEGGVPCHSSRLGVEVKRTSVSRRAYLGKCSPQVEEGQGAALRKAEASGRRKKRYSAPLRDEIGSYAAQHGVPLAVQHYSERLLFPVCERTIAKFLRMYQEKEGKKHQKDIYEGEFNRTASQGAECKAGDPSLHPQGGSVLPNPLLGNSLDVLAEGSGSLATYGQCDRLTPQQQMVDYHVNSPGCESAALIVNSGASNASTSYCQELSFRHHTVQSYSSDNFPEPGIPPTTAGSLEMDHGTPAMDEIVPSERMGEEHNVPEAHSSSPQHGSMEMTLSHQAADVCDSSSSRLIGCQVILPPGDASREIISCQSEEGSLESSSVLMTVLPASSYIHLGKSQVLISSSLLNQSGADGSSLANSNVASLHKTKESEIMAPYYPLTLSTSHTCLINNGFIGASVQVSEDNSVAICGNSQIQLLGESVTSPYPLEHQSSKSNKKEIPSTSEIELDRLVGGAVPKEAVAMCKLVGGCEEETTGDTGGVLLPVADNLSAVSAKVCGDERGKLKLKGLRKAKCCQKLKRGNYTFLSPELRARIGRYAAEHGNLKAAKHFETEVGRQIPESTIRGLRDKYVMKQMHVSAQSSEGEGSRQLVTTLGYSPRGRPMVLGKYDEVVQECVRELVQAGEKVCSMLAIATARQVLTQYEPSLLEEFGGPVKLNNSWAKSFIKRIGLGCNS